ncbi:MAG: methyltransferase domain-containing protein [Pseudonocardiaceae bacterium]
MVDREGYAPGWTSDALVMMGQRSAQERAAFVFPYLTEDIRVLDVGCGPGTITIGLAQAVSPHGVVVGIDRESSQVELARQASQTMGVSNVRFEQGFAYKLPVDKGSVDVVFAHALFEHLASPRQALIEFRRVLRAGGVVALTSSDWSAATLEPWNDDIDWALGAHYLLRKWAGGDPFTGGRLETLVREAGFMDVHARHEDRIDMSYDQLARYVGTRIESAVAAGVGDYQATLEKAAQAARRWATQRGTFTQRWIEVVARFPG